MLSCAPQKCIVYPQNTLFIWIKCIYLYYTNFVSFCLRCLCVHHKHSITFTTHTRIDYVFYYFMTNSPYASFRIAIKIKLLEELPINSMVFMIDWTSDFTWFFLSQTYARIIQINGLEFSYIKFIYINFYIALNISDFLLGNFSLWENFLLLRHTFRLVSKADESFCYELVIFFLDQVQVGQTEQIF